MDEDEVNTAVHTTIIVKNADCIIASVSIEVRDFGGFPVLTFLLITLKNYSSSTLYFIKQNFYLA